MTTLSKSELIWLIDLMNESIDEEDFYDLAEAIAITLKLKLMLEEIRFG